MEQRALMRPDRIRFTKLMPGRIKPAVGGAQPSVQTQQANFS